MSNITAPILTDATFAAKMDTQNALLAALVSGSISETESFQQIHAIVQQGMAPKVFSIGDQIVVPWTDTNGTVYQVPLDIVHFGNVELKDGSTVPGMFLQWHYATAVGIPFDANEAFWYCSSALPAGTYYITATNGWGSNIVSGESYQFTTTVEVPVGGHLVLTTGTVDTAFANWKVYTYKDGATTTPLETIVPSKGASGTKLGDWSSNTKFSTSGVNNMQRSNYGYNRWSQSALRQYLNSEKAAGAWWTSKNVFDRIPTECASNRGFMAGFSDDFKAVIKPVKVRTYLNTTSDSEISPNYEDTFDIWFPASLEQEFCNPQIAGEGDYWEYWKQRVGHANPTAQYATEAERIRYAINGKTSPQACRLRSAIRGYSYFTWLVSTTGNVYGYHAGAAHAFRCAPACVVC